jgi:hypothetical protein
MTAQENPDVVIRARLPGAASAYLVAPCNNWSTIASPMTRRGDDDWEIALPADASVEPHCFYVRESGDRWGRIVWAASPTVQNELSSYG